MHPRVIEMIVGGRPFVAGGREVITPPSNNTRWVQAVRPGVLLDTHTFIVTHTPHEPSITCLRPGCGMTSWHPIDVREMYCGNCHRFHERLDRVEAY